MVSRQDIANASNFVDCTFNLQNFVFLRDQLIIIRTIEFVYILDKFFHFNKNLVDIFLGRYKHTKWVILARSGIKVYVHNGIGLGCLERGQAIGYERDGAIYK